MQVIELYFAPGACSLVSHIALEEAGISFTPHPLSLLAGQHKTASYLRLNPSGKVPTLIVDGRPLAENLAILAWIHDRAPDVGILPRCSDSFERQTALSTLHWFAATVHPVFTRFRVPPAIVDDPSSFHKVAARAASVLADYFSIASVRLGSGEWLLGDWCSADTFLFWLWTEATAGGFDQTLFPTLAAHAKRVATRPATLRALRREADAIAEFKKNGLKMPFEGL
jgi:glutathione S-transferase